MLMDPIEFCQPWVTTLWEEERCRGAAVLGDWERTCHAGQSWCCSTRTVSASASSGAVLQCSQGYRGEIGDLARDRAWGSWWMAIGLKWSWRAVPRNFASYLSSILWDSTCITQLILCLVSYLQCENNGTSLSLGVAVVLNKLGTFILW